MKINNMLRQSMHAVHEEERILLFALREMALVDKLVLHSYTDKLNSFFITLRLYVGKYCDFQRKILTSHNIAVVIYMLSGPKWLWRLPLKKMG